MDTFQMGSGLASPVAMDPHRQPQWGYYQFANTPAVPVQIDQIELSGWAYTANGPVRFNRSRVVPAQTRLQGACACPIQWRIGGV